MGVIKLNLKNILKAIKLNESTISMALGALVIVIVGVLVVNYFKKNPSTSVPGTTTQEEAVPQAGEKYKVVEGDSLWKISEKAYGSGYNWIDIAKENKLSEADSIEAGQEISLPKVESKLATITDTLPTVEPTTEGITGASYTVVKGDSLWKIAVRAYGDGYKWSQIAKENNLLHPNIIHPGNILTLPR